MLKDVEKKLPGMQLEPLLDKLGPPDCYSCAGNEPAKRLRLGDDLKAICSEHNTQPVVLTYCMEYGSLEIQIYRNSVKAFKFDPMIYE